MTMSISLTQSKAPTVVSGLILTASLLALFVLVPARATFGQDQTSADTQAAPAATEQDSAAKSDGGDQDDGGDKKDGESDAASESKPAEADKESGDTPATPADGENASEKPAAAPAEPTADPEWVAKGVWTLPPTEGAAATDFSLVGEYEGDLKATDSSEGGRVGVQIRNLGEGEFEARVHQGGLPGQDGFDNEKPRVLLGRRSDQTLVLSGGPWAMFATPGNCKIIDASGNILATLDRAQRHSPTLGAAAPEGAIVLFNGSDTSAFTNAEMTTEGLLQQGADIREMLGDFDLHVEFRIPFMPKFRDQQRGNSGVYLQSRYECQVLDSFADANVFNGLGALYRYKTPKMNMAFPPLTWQTYDIHFTAARYAADGSKLRNARVTSWVNGVMVQDNEELPGPTGAGKDESPTLLPTKIQNHGDPVRFRNVWAIDRGMTGGIEFPQMAK